MAFATDPILCVGSYYNTYDTIMSFLLLGISIIGLYYSYKINSHGDNKKFIVRIMCLGLPILIRIFVILIPILIVGTIIEEMFILTDEELEHDIEAFVAYCFLFNTASAIANVITVSSVNLLFF